MDQVTRITQDPNGLGLTTTYSYDGLGRQLEVSRGTVAAPRQQVTRYEFDHLGRRVAEYVDPDGLNLTTRYVYNANDQIEQKIQVLNTSTSYKTLYAYDSAGRLTSTTDALGYKESYTYDAVGNRKTLTNKKGDVWTYNYDSLNRLTEEISPKISVGSIDAAGNVSSGAYHVVTRIAYDNAGNVLSRTEGVLRSTVNGADNNQQARTTRYTYDKLNRQIGIISPGWYNKSTGAYQQASDGTANTLQITTEVTYDIAGNAVRNRVRVNNTGNSATDFVDSYKVYDKLGRVTHEIDALGGVTAYTYDELGNQLTFKRFANGLTGAVPARGYYLADDIVTKVNAASTGNLLLDATKDRTLTNAYDKAGRKVSVQQDLSNIFTFTGNVSTSTLRTLAPTTLYTYDALGRVVKETLVGRDGSGAIQTTGPSTTYYYDATGNRTGVVDALGHYTRMEYDRLGRLERQMEYSTALPSWNHGAAPAAPASTENDRSTRYSHDALGRVIQVTRENARYWVQNATDLSGRVTDQEMRGDLIESRTSYDAVGNIRTVTDALNNVTTTEYNALGQVTRLIEPQRWAAKAGVVDPFALGFGGIVLASPTTTYEMNAFGQVIREIRAAGVDASSNAQSGVTQHSRTLYDSAGNEVKSIDASNAVETYKVDAAGRRIEELQQVSMTLNAWTWLDGNKFQYTQDIRRNFEYDKLGRQTATIAWYGDWDGQTKAARESAEYNHFGEITAKRMNGGLIGLYNYNQLGRVESYVDQQKWIVAVDYDLAGNATRSNQIGQLWGSPDDDRITYTLYDKLGRAIEQHLPGFSANTSADTLNNVGLAKVTPVIKQVFDRWGNVTLRTDARGQNTFYNYDHNNRLWAETHTATDILRENGTIYRANTMQQYHYDAVGKHIATQDWVWPYSGQANFTLLRTRHYVHNQVGEMEREVDALGNWRTYRMDAHGNRIATRDAAGVVTVSTYDSMNRLTTHSIMRNGARVVLQTNRYDQAGRLVAEIAGSAEVEETLQSIANTSNWSSNTTGAIGNTRYTLHDARGNILWTRNESGVAMRYGYDAYSRKVTEWDGLRNTRTWSYSPGDWSRMSSHKDLGGRIFNYTYNFFGELERETYVGPDTDGFVGPNPGGIRLERKYAYYENGLLQSIIDTETEGPESSSYSTNKDISAYEYNISGSKTRDTTWKLQNITVEINGTSSTHLWSQAISEVRYLYDEVGRIKGLKMPTGQNLVGSEDHDSWAMYATMNTGRLDALIYDYDELGNRRRVQLDTTDQSNKRTTIDNWYKYDQEGRVLVAEGFLSNGQVVAGKGKGYAMAYNATGQRIFQVKWDKTIDSGTWERYQKDTYTYNDLGLLLNRTMHYENLNVGANYSGAVVSSQSQGLVYSNTYDDLGRRLSQTEYKNGAAYSTVTYSYRGDNQLISQLTYKMDGSRQYLSQATHFAEAGMRDGAGNQTAYRYVIYKSNGGIDYRGNYTTNYAAFDSYKESKTMATWTKSGSPGTTTYRYTDRGELLQVEVTGAKSYTKMFASNREGQFIASKRSDSHNGQSYIYVQGREVANIGNASAPEITDTIEQITKDTFGLTPTNYVVSQGDTLQSIALQVWGDDSMWYLIADANGIVAGDELTPGDSLKIPNVLGATHNDANDFKPYNPRDVIGDTTPQPKLPKPKKKKSGGLGSIVMVVVAVVAAVFTAGAAAAAFAAIGSTAGVGVGTAALTGGLGALGIGAGAAGLGLSIGATAAIGGGIVGGAIGSAAGQLTGMAMGIVDNFSWSQVAAGALSGGAASGLSVAAQGMLGGGWIQSAAKAVTANSYQGYATYGVFNYASHQLINKVVGFDTSFSWRGMAASIMGSTIGGAVGSSDYLKGMPRFARNIVSGQISAHSSAALNDKWLGGAQPQHGQIAVDAFGNILAASILSTMESQIKPDLLKDKSLLLASNNSTITLPPTYVYANESEQDTSIAKNNGSSPHLRRIAGENAFDEFLLGFTDGFTELRGLSRENIYNSNSALEAGIASGVYAVNSLTSVVVGGLVDVGRIFTSSEQRSQLGSALHTLVTTNPATTAENAWSAWHALSTEDRLLTAGSVLTGAGVSKIGKIGDVLPNSAPALSRGAELRIKYGHLSAEQRYSIISERTEEIALRQLHTKQAATPGAHFLARHSAETTLREQLVSAATGLRPDGKIMGGANKPFTVDSTKFLSNKDMLYGINRAERIQQHAISTGNPVDDYISLRFSDFVGEGFVKNTPMYGADLSRFYRQTYYANFLINPSTGTAVTAFPVLSLNSLGVLY
ncbi:LysM peptidoglycan-binding domain-containing protein [Pseudomonas paralcaligenes]|uniref:LysM peptidoglycan-binding domain-containing protein n=1 Tax=Pseudomonas paralcaligenes TaxID=2772558 RepID=UPI0021D3C989|nr:LysM peptidoglycan-binding domain-containing protein [Pseudomonas paralcaligenes]